MSTGQKKVVRVEYMCRWCGTKTLKSVLAGRPLPGNCPRRPKNRMGKSQPHSWVINRKFYGV